MRLDTKEEIAGFTAREVRDVLRELRYGAHLEWFQAVLKTSQAKARRLCRELEDRKLLRKERMPNKRLGYVCTTAGNQFAAATFLKSIQRTEADKLYAGFIERVAEVNRSPEYAWCVKRVAIFGSYLGDSRLVNDLDLAVDLVRKYTERDWQQVFDAQIRAAEQAGRRFRSIHEELSWPERKVWQFLRARSPRFSFHLYDELAGLGCAYRDVFPERTPK